MNTEKMKQDLGGGAVFDMGESNTAFGQYFVGQSYLKMLTTEGVGIGNVTFEPGCATTGIFITRRKTADRFCSAPAAEAGTRSGEKRQESFIPVTW